MTAQSFHIPASPTRDEILTRITRFLSQLSAAKAWRVEVAEHRPRRTISQNALLWSLYTQILARGGLDMAGWEKEDLHTFFLINHFGSEVREIFGKPRHVPLRTSSKLNKQEFSDLMDSIIRFMAERGVALDMPGD